jgi:hypothetical protein
LKANILVLLMALAIVDYESSNLHQQENRQSQQEAQPEDRGNCGQASNCRQDLNYEFMRHAIGLLVGLLCPVVGSYLVVQRMALLGDVIAHCVLPGLSLFRFQGLDRPRSSRQHSVII